MAMRMELDVYPVGGDSRYLIGSHELKEALSAKFFPVQSQSSGELFRNATLLRRIERVCIVYDHAHRGFDASFQVEVRTIRAAPILQLVATETMPRLPK